MSKNRDRRGNGPTAKPQDLPPEAESEALPGGEDDGVGEATSEKMMEKVFEDELRKNLGDEVANRLLGVDKAKDDGEMSVVALKTGEKNRLSRAQMHLDWLIQEITALANEGALVGVFRKACAECRVVFNDSSAALWGPLKSVSAVLETVRKNGGV